MSADHLVLPIAGTFLITATFFHASESDSRPMPRYPHEFVRILPNPGFENENHSGVSRFPFRLQPDDQITTDGFSVFP